MPATSSRIPLFTRIIAIGLLGAGAALLAIALLLPLPSYRDTTRIATTALGPAWHAVPWGVTVTPGNEGLSIAPTVPGTAWTGFRLQRKRKEPARDLTRPALDEEWLARGVLSFALRGGADAAGTEHPPPPLQVFIHTAPAQVAGHALRLRPRDFAPSTDGAWRRASVPLARFDAPAPSALFGVAFQVVGELNHAFLIKDVGLALHDSPPLPGAGTSEEAEFAALVELPPALAEPPAEMPAIGRGTFVRNGAPTFLLGTQCNYDMRHDLWGDSLTPPTQSKERWEGYAPDLAWLYETLPARPLFARVGFNAWIALAPPQAFLGEYVKEFPVVLSAFDAAQLPALARGIALPLGIDLTLFDWTMEALRPSVPPDALAPPGHHSMPFGLSGPGRELYLRYFTRTAEFMRHNAMPVFQFELFNEPDFPLPDAAAARDLPALHAESTRLRAEFLQLVEAGMAAVRTAYGPALFSVQLNRNDVVEGTPLLAPEELFARLPLVTSPTDGGIWTFGSAAAAPPVRPIDSPLAPAPLSADLLLAFGADAKPILDHEMTCPGTAAALTRALWTRVLLGFDGAFLFQWSKRAWEWHTAEEGARLAARYEFCLLNPHAHPPSELAAVMRFRRDLLPHEELLLPKPFGVAPAVVFVHCYANELAHRAVPTDRALGRAAYAALRYTHVPMAVVTEATFRTRIAPEGAAGAPAIRACVLGGATCLERATVPALERFAARGGTVIIVDSATRFDAAGAPLDLAPLTGAAYGEEDRAEVILPDVPPCGVPGDVAGLAFRKLALTAARPVFSDTRGECRVACRRIGAGAIYTVAFQAKGCALVRLLGALLGPEGIDAPWMLTTDAGGRALNVLLSVRDRGARKAVLLANQDAYAKRVRWRWYGLGTGWRVRAFLEDERGTTSTWTDDGAVLTLPAGGVKLLVLERGEAGR